MCRGAYIPYFKVNVPIFCCPLFFEEYLNPQVRINKMVSEYSVNCHTSPSGLTLRIQPLSYFSGFLWGLSLSRIFDEFVLKHVYPTMIGKIFKFMVLRLLDNVFVSEKIKSINFYSCPQAKLSARFSSSPPRQKEITHFPKAAFCENLFSRSRKGRGGHCGTEKRPKLNLRG